MGFKVDSRYKHPALEQECRRVHLGCLRLLDRKDHKKHDDWPPHFLVDDVLQSSYMITEMLECRTPGLLGYRNYLKIFVIANCPFFAYRGAASWKHWAATATARYGTFRAREHSTADYNMPFDERDLYDY